MSRLLPSISVIVAVSLKEPWVAEILEHGAKFGATYLNGTERAIFADYTEAARIGMYPDHDSDEMQFLIMQVGEMESYLSFEKTKQNNLLMRLSPAGNHWERADNNTFIDIARYVRFLFNMIEDFYILGLRVVDEGCEDIFDDVLY